MNSDSNVIKSFGYEWEKYNQSSLLKDELAKTFEEYFHIFPQHLLNKESIGFDMGSGSGRWAYFVSEKVKRLTVIEPSKRALNASKELLKDRNNISFLNATVSESVNKLQEKKFDFGYSLGVLHHVPNTLEALRCCNKLLKPGAPFLLYLYYDFENRNFLFKSLWSITVPIRSIISIMPQKFKYLFSELLALIVYLPIQATLRLLKRLGFNIEGLPLSNYVNKSFKTLRTDAYDRFATKIEKRFSRAQIIKMINSSGFTFSHFSTKQPFWTVLCYSN